MAKVYESGDSIDVNALIKAVRELAAERPDFVYVSSPYTEGPACYYTTPEGEGDCIFGCAMERIGQPLPPQLREGNNDLELLNGPVSTEEWADALGIEFGDELHTWIRRVQSAQDQGYSWSSAVAGADEAAAVRVN